MLSQYANSPKFVKLVEGLKSQISNANTIEDWVRVVYDLKTASGYGLDVWGVILNQGRLLYYKDEYGIQRSVYLRGAQTIGSEDYKEEQIEGYYRMLLFFKAFSYVTNSTLKSFNDLLRFYFEDKKVFVQEIGTMVIELVFRFFPTTLEKIIFASDLFPKPTGVGLNFRFIPTGEWFGFFDKSVVNPEDQPFAPFNHKPFYPYEPS